MNFFLQKSRIQFSSASCFIIQAQNVTCRELTLPLNTGLRNIYRYTYCIRELGNNRVYDIKQQNERKKLNTLSTFTLILFVIIQRWCELITNSIKTSITIFMGNSVCG